MLTLDNPRLKADNYSIKTSLATTCLHVSKTESFRASVSHQESTSRPPVRDVSTSSFLLNLMFTHSLFPRVLWLLPCWPPPSAPRTVRHVCVKLSAAPPSCSKRTAPVTRCSLLHLSSQWHFLSLSVVVVLARSHRQSVLSLQLTEALQSCFSVLFSFYNTFLLCLRR